MRRLTSCGSRDAETNPPVHRRSGLFGPRRRTSFSGVICSARAAVSLFLPSRTGRLFAFLWARLNGAQLHRRAECCRDAAVITAVVMYL